MGLKRLKIALIADEITSYCLSMECKTAQLTPRNYKLIIDYWKPDFIFIESAWHGYKNKWQYKISSLPNGDCQTEHFEKVINYATKKNIKTVFWNKEDGYHFNRFIHSAKICDYIFTVDFDMITEYKKIVPEKTNKIHVLPFAVQPTLHYPSSEDITRTKGFCFIGSYDNQIHKERQNYLNMFFASAENYGLYFYDRNSHRGSSKYRLPETYNANIYPRIAHKNTRKIYQKYHGYFNVNTVNKSPSMFSRRLIEIMACGSPVISSPATSLSQLQFADFIFVATCVEDTCDYLDLLSKPYDKILKEKLREGANFILQNHTYRHRLNYILEKMNI